MSKLVNHSKRGLVVHAGEKTAKMIVKIVREQFADQYPAFFTTPLGQRVESFVICMSLHEISRKMEFPKARLMETLAGYALEGSSGEIAGLLEEFMTPLVTKLSKINLDFLDLDYEDDDEDEDDD